jgi:hypothetical protein
MSSFWPAPTTLPSGLTRYAPTLTRPAAPSGSVASARAALTAPVPGGTVNEK